MSGNRFNDFVTTQAPLAMTIPETRRMTGYSRSRVYQALRDGKLKAVKAGRSTLVLTDSITSMLAALPEATFRPPNRTAAELSTKRAA